MNVDFAIYNNTSIPVQYLLKTKLRHTNLSLNFIKLEKLYLIMQIL